MTDPNNRPAAAIPWPPRRVYVRLNPHLDHTRSPLRRALHAAGLILPFAPGGAPQAATPTTLPTPRQETPAP
jgi:hypothetical protein